MGQLAYKDEQLDHLATLGNVAQFVSFAPDTRQRYARILGKCPNQMFTASETAVSTLLEKSHDGRLNVRSFRPESPQGNEFIYGLSDAQAAVSAIKRLTSSGLFVIVNETIDINDGGVSGVAQGGLFEFAPGATPRIVEDGAIASLPESAALRILAGVYKFEPSLPAKQDMRIEFSIHPYKCGFQKTHTILWEAEETTISHLESKVRWPNLFSELIGDKAFGLLVADAYGYSVPRTTVICRKIQPFVFGKTTGEDTVWMRTAPRQAEPGLYPTVRGWTDPFGLMREAPGEEHLASLLIQDEVRSVFSGALISTSDGQVLIEGVEGFGDDFMLGKSRPVELPKTLSKRLLSLHDDLRSKLGGIRAEWAYDGSDVWILQLQQIQAMSSGRIIVPGEVEKEVIFEVKEGLPALRKLVNVIAPRTGIRIVGEIGMTSHIADILRRARIPSRMA